MSLATRKMMPTKPLDEAGKLEEWRAAGEKIGAAFPSGRVLSEASAGIGTASRQTRSASRRKNLMTPNEAINVLRAALLKAKRSHYYCEDCWYTCPKHPEGCCNEAVPKDVCDCGADEFNAEIDRVLLETSPERR